MNREIAKLRKHESREGFVLHTVEIFEGCANLNLPQRTRRTQRHQSGAFPWCSSRHGGQAVFFVAIMLRLCRAVQFPTFALSHFRDFVI
jgi:hypothetical protein